MTRFYRGNANNGFVHGNLSYTDVEKAIQYNYRQFWAVTHDIERKPLAYIIGRNADEWRKPTSYSMTEWSNEVSSYYQDSLEAQFSSTAFLNMDGLRYRNARTEIWDELVHDTLTKMANDGFFTYERIHLD